MKEKYYKRDYYNHLKISFNSITAKGDCAWCIAEIGFAVAGCIATGVSGGAAIIACVSGIIGAGTMIAFYLMTLLYLNGVL